MDVTIIGTGLMARALATRFVSGKASVRLLAHENEADAVAAAQAVHGSFPGSDIGTGVIGDAIDSDVVVLAVPFSAVSGIAKLYPGGLSGKVLVDITNPVAQDFDGLSTPLDSSAAEQVSLMFPGASVVKAFNTTFAGTLMAGQLAGQQLDVFVASDDDDAKRKVLALAESGGLRALDAGPLRRARQLEQLSFLHMTMLQARGTGFASAIKLIP